MDIHSCVHISAIQAVKHSKSSQCEECVKIGSRWVHLRTCQTCGVTLCCDLSPNRHASKHARAASHFRDRLRSARGTLVVLFLGRCVRGILNQMSEGLGSR